MNWASIDISDIRSYFDNILSHLNENMRKINIANRMFVENGLEISETYKNILKKYDADILEVDFKKIKETVDIINKWGVGKSEGLIKEIITSDLINSVTIGIITSLMTFRGKWKIPFKNNLTREAEFLSEKGIVTNVKMMYNIGYFKHGYFPEYELSVLELPYDIPDIVMVILIPSNLKDFKKSLAKDGGEFLLQLNSKIKDHNVEICLPKFKITTNFSLEGKLQDIGIKSLFNSETSNMKRMSPNADFYVQKIIQGVQIEVDEEETEGAAYSTSIIGSRSLSTSLCADKPFIFYIQEIKYKTVLFWGEYKTPVN
uniref:Putative venom serpin-like protein ase inhibitor n=1 Tax=Tityus obscurus TaxID=1221240 RepID=A0A1E1WVZ3_TITOB